MFTKEMIMTKPSPLVNILESNNLEEILYLIMVVPEMSRYDSIWRKFSLLSASQNVEKIVKYCSNEDYELINEWLETGNLDIRMSAQNVALSVCRSISESAWSSVEAESAWYAARSIAESAAESAVDSVESAWSAIWSATKLEAKSATWYAGKGADWHAAWFATESVQKDKLRELILQ